VPIPPIIPTSDDTVLERPVQQTLDDMEAAELAAAAAAIRSASAPDPRGPSAAAERSIRDSAAGTSIRDLPGRVPPRESRTQDVPVRAGTLARTGRRAVSRTPLLIGLGVIALILLIGGVGAYLVLPSATIVVAPKEEPVGPVSVTIRADPTADAPDPDAGVVPAAIVSLDLSATNTFPATGKRVVSTRATGTVRFENRDPTSSNTIPSGSIVRTDDGIRFETNAAVTVPRAELVFPKVIPRFATVKVTAVDKGPDGNVDADRVVEVPRTENGQFLKVTNQDPTDGGKRDEFPKVVQADIDGALAALEPALQAALVARLADPTIVPAGATLFPETAELGVPVPSVDPASLLDQEIATFDLSLSATATVTAVDSGPVESIAAERLRATIDGAHRLVDGSIKVTVEPAVISGDQISFPASATATEVAILDADDLKTQVIGRPVEEARSLLEAYGTVQLSVWPDWVSTIPTMDGRVQLTLDEAVPVETPPPTAAP
jgi:Baseplate J-like protein